MFRSLKNQIIVVLAILISILVLQVYFSRTTQSILMQSQISINYSYENVALVYELERDIIDLQRHLLIHKETASSTSISRFYELMTLIKVKLTLFEKDEKIVSSSTLESDLLKRMREHLNDYEENFSSVISLRTQRKVISDKNIRLKFNNLNQLITKQDFIDSTALAIKLHLAIAEKNINQYLISPDSEKKH